MWWEVFGIERQATIKEVKRAYSKLIKTAYQSDDQNEIIRIQNAYQSACDYIKAQSEERKEVFKSSIDVRNNNPVFTFNHYEKTHREYTQSNNIEDDELNNIEDTELNNIDEIDSKNIEELKEVEKIKSNNIDDTDDKEIDSIIWEEIENDELDGKYVYSEVQSALKNCKDKFDSIYTDTSKRVKVEEWKVLFGSFSFNEEEYIQKHAYKYFNKYCHLPHDIWLIIDENLKLSSNPMFRWKEKITFDDKLQYIYEGYSYEELERLFTLRNEACEAYLNWDYENCLNICEQAIKINSNEPVLIKLKGLCYFELGNYKLSYDNFKELQSYETYEVEAKRYIGEIYLKNNENKKARLLFKKVNKQDSGILTTKGIIKALRGENRKLKSYFEYRLYRIGSERDKLLKFEFNTRVDRFLLKNNFFKISSFYNGIRYLRDVLLFLGTILLVFAIIVALIIGLFTVFYKVAIGFLILYLIRRKTKKSKGGK